MLRATEDARRQRSAVTFDDERGGDAVAVDAVHRLARVVGAVVDGDARQRQRAVGVDGDARLVLQLQRLAVALPHDDETDDLSGVRHGAATERHVGADHRLLPLRPRHDARPL